MLLVEGAAAGGSVVVVLIKIIAQVNCSGPIDKGPPALIGWIDSLGQVLAGDDDGPPSPCPSWHQ